VDCHADYHNGERRMAQPASVTAYQGQERPLASDYELPERASLRTQSTNVVGARRLPDIVGSRGPAGQQAQGILGG